MSRSRPTQRGTRRRPNASSFEQRPWQILRNLYRPTQIISEDALEAIHCCSLRILEEVGMDFLLPEARAILKAKGAEVRADSQNVRIPRALVKQALATAPSEFLLHSRNPERVLPIGGNALVFCSVASAPNAHDRIKGRRPGNHEDYRNFLKLGQQLNAIQLWGGYPVEPTDWHASVRHLYALKDQALMSDKAMNAYSLGRDRILDAIELARLARGIDDNTLEKEPSLVSVINTSSPLRLDAPMLWGIIEMARYNQPVIVTPFTLAGAMAPITLAGALAQQNAEVLAGLVMSQAVREGAPFVYGAFTSNVDMKSGAPAFGTPEAMKATLASGQLARKYGLPLRTSNVNAANTLDAQAAYESVFSLMALVMGGANIVMHGAGWMEGGLQASFEKMVLDADLISMVAELLNPFHVNDAELAFETIKEVGTEGHFFGTTHTKARYKNAFYKPMISDWRNYESWQEAGSPTAYDRAEKLYHKLLESYEAPAIEPERREAIEAFVARRIEEGGAHTDF